MMYMLLLLFFFCYIYVGPLTSTFVATFDSISVSIVSNLILSTVSTDAFFFGTVAINYFALVDFCTYTSHLSVGEFVFTSLAIGTSSLSTKEFGVSFTLGK
jgi:hypothetical protein